MKCKKCGKGRPKLWTKHGGFCDIYCYREWEKEHLSEDALKLVTLSKKSI